MVRAKFQLSEIHGFAGFQGKKFVFTLQYDPTIAEDRRFAKSSPSGGFHIFVDNLAVESQFVLGKQYYFDVTEVPVALPA